MYDFKELKIEEYDQKPEQFVVIDVRSPGEFAVDHMEGSTNIPIFNNVEREILGTLYKEKGIREARRAARTIVLTKISGLLDEIDGIREETGKKVLVYCARGGDRSALMATFLSMESHDVYRLTGGYKSYRQYLLRYFNEGFCLEVCSFYGHTGTGKTEFLLKLQQLGLPVIDLEGLANHRGSVFGHVGLGQQPSQKRFDTLLYTALRGLSSDVVLVEGESKKIGRIYIPERFYARMIEGTAYFIEGTLEKRIQRIIKEYGGSLIQNKEEIIGALTCLTASLGRD